MTEDIATTKLLGYEWLAASIREAWNSAEAREFHTYIDDIGNPDATWDAFRNRLQNWRAEHSRPISDRWPHIDKMLRGIDVEKSAVVKELQDCRETLDDSWNRDFDRSEIDGLILDITNPNRRAESKVGFYGSRIDTPADQERADQALQEARNGPNTKAAVREPANQLAGPSRPALQVPTGTTNARTAQTPGM